MRAEDIFGVAAAKAPALQYLKAKIAYSNPAWFQPGYFMNLRLGVTATADMVIIPGVRGPSFAWLRTSSLCDVPFRYASASIVDLGFRISDFLQQFMI
jgi:hypothetical protein